MRVLVTGAAGLIGGVFARATSDRFELLLTDRPGTDWGDLQALAEVREADIADAGALRSLCEGVEVVLHLAGEANPEAEWSSVLPANVIGTHNLYEAARAGGCRRVVYASSVHTVTGYATDVQVRTTDPVNPGDVYGASKCWGEALGRYMAEQEGLSVIAVRIGAFSPADGSVDPTNPLTRDIFVSERDLCDLLVRCIEAPDVGFAIVHGVSDNRFKRLDLSDTSALLGYHPRDSA